MYDTEVNGERTGNNVYEHHWVRRQVMQSAKELGELRGESLLYIPCNNKSNDFDMVTEESKFLKGLSAGDGGTCNFIPVKVVLVASKQISNYW